MLGLFGTLNMASRSLQTQMTGVEITGQNLANVNTTSISGTGTTNLQKDENNIAYQAANNGVLQNQLTAASTFATNRVQSLDTMVSNASSADLMQTMVQLNSAQTAYQAALESGAKIMQMSILNYLQ